jgi:hypothetical protein
MKTKPEFKLGQAVPKEWFATEEAKDRKAKLDKSGEKLSASFKASMIVDEALLKSRITK